MEDMTASLLASDGRSRKKLKSHAKVRAKHTGGELAEEFGDFDLSWILGCDVTAEDA
jgi:hypothetical protein